jgi:hypothetical protein
MAVGLDSRPQKGDSSLDHALPLQPVGNAMSYNPLTQPSGPSFPVPETTTLPGLEAHAEYNASLSAHADSLSHRLAVKRRRSSKDTPKTAATLRRSSSTPHMRNMALGNTGDLSPTGDKRRNKLGYHRTSVACGEFLPIA